MSVSKKDVTFNELPTNELSIWQLTLLCNCYFRVTALSSRVIGLVLQRQLSNLTAGVKKNSAFNNWPLFTSRCGLGKQICNSKKFMSHTTGDLH